MAQLRCGSAESSPTIRALATQLAAELPEGAQVLAGVMLAAAPPDRTVVIDLVVFTRGTAFAGVDAGPAGNVDTASQDAALVLAGALKSSRLLTQPLPIYALGLGSTKPEQQPSRAPIFADAASLCQYILAATADERALPGRLVALLAAELLHQDARAKKQAPLRGLQSALSDLVAVPGRIDAGLQNWIRQPFPWLRSGPVLPADVNRHLEAAMLRRENVLEDADYGQVVPNAYVVEVNEQNYRQHYQPIEAQIRKRWQAHLMSSLDTANRRWGQTRYRFGGGVRVSIQPVPDLAQDQVRVCGHIEPDSQARLPGTATAHLETLDTSRQWPLHQGRNVIGREESCDVYLDLAAVQQARLVSGQHACIVYQNGTYTLFDGTSEGRPSTNGTFVNGQPVKPQGRVLSDRDLIVLAALDASRPVPDTPGVAALRFRIPNLVEHT